MHILFIFLVFSGKFSIAADNCAKIPNSVAVITAGVFEGCRLLSVDPNSTQGLLGFKKGDIVNPKVGTGSLKTTTPYTPEKTKPNSN